LREIGNVFGKERWPLLPGQDELHFELEPAIRPVRFAEQLIELVLLPLEQIVINPVGRDSAARPARVLELSVVIVDHRLPGKDIRVVLLAPGMRRPQECPALELLVQRQRTAAR
jgi:hypothetical protein